MSNKANTQIFLADITRHMEDHDARHAPGSETAQWQAYWAEVFDLFGDSPDACADQEVPADFAMYWISIAEEDYATAKEFGHVCEEWIENTEA